MLNTVSTTASGSTGQQVKNLHEALLSIARKRAVPGFMILLEDPTFLQRWNIEYQASEYGDATRQAITFFQQKHMGIEPTGTVDGATASAVNKLQGGSSAMLKKSSSGDGVPKVYGIVYDEWIEPMQGAPVMVFDKDIRSEHLMCEGETDEKGSYSIAYPASKLNRQDKGGANLIVRVYGSDGNPLHASDVYYNAPAQLEVNVNLGPRAYMGASEFVKNTAQVKEFIGKLAIHELTENSKVHDLSFLINKTGLAANLLLQLVASFRFEKWTGIEAEVYYGILSNNKAFPAAKTAKGKLPADADTTIEKAYINFWGATIPGMMAGLQQAATKNVVTYKLLKHKDDIQAALEKLQAAPPQEATATQPLPPVYSNTKAAGLNDAQQKAFLGLYSATSVSNAFWATLAKDPSFQGTAGTAAVNKLQAVYQLAAWTGNNTTLTSYITQTYSVTAVNSFSSLVQNDVSDWVNIITASGAVPVTAAGASTTINGLAVSIATGIEQMYPTQVFSARFTKSTTLNISNKTYITGILNAADFDITNSSVGAYVTSYIKNNPVPDTTDQKAVTYQVMGLQRTYKVAQGSDAALTLLADNIQSARQVYAMGRTNFVSKYQTPLGSENAAGAVFDRAAQVHAGATHLMGQVTSRLNNPGLNVMPAYGDEFKKSNLLSDYPDLANLFGMAPAYCECTDCESFLGIPAYVADLLDYLFLRGTAYKGNARALLQANDYAYPYLDPNACTWRRRPDIGDIDLDCDNANVELPYIDLVNELLEDYIVPPLACIEVPLIGDGEQLKIDYFIEWIIYFLSPGKIKPVLYEMLHKIGSLAKTPICNIDLLTNQATVSGMFLTDGENYPAWIGTGPLIAQWVIRDQFITLKLILVLGGRSIKEIQTLFGKDVIVFEKEGFKENKGDGLFDPNLKIQTQDNSVDTPAGVSVDMASATPNENAGGSPVYVEGSRASGTTQGGSNTKQTMAFWEEYFRAAGGGDQDEDEQRFALVVQEIHQTHLSTDEINANPEYTNTNVYNSFSDPFNDLGNNKWDLYPTLIPLSMPFDLYFAEANVFLNKMGVQRYSLINTFQKQGLASDDSIAIAYLGLSTGDADIIFKERIQPFGPGSQHRFWGPLAGKTSVEVDLFLAAAGLSFQQLQTLLSLKFINPNNDSYIAENNNLLGAIFDPCNTANMLIINMTAVKFDHINRFLRLWNKLNALTTISMHELDLCISSPVLGNNKLLLPFAQHMYYFLQLMAQMSLTATQTLVFYGDIDYSKDIYDATDISLYQQLFQNRQISNPLVAAFNMPLNTTSLITDTKTNPGAIPVILTACGIAQADLTAIITLNSSYANLTLDNLSVIYACGLLSNALSISVQDLILFSSLLGINPLHQITSTATAANPADTFNFIAKFNEVQQAGFTVDGINYILNNQSADTPSLIPNVTSVVNGLLGIRTALQTAITATTVMPDPQGALLKTWLADPDLSWDATIAAKVAAILATAGTAGYNAQIQANLRFLQLLNTEYQQTGAAAYLQQLPAITFPDKGITNITYDNSGYYLFYYGTMTSKLFTFLQAAAPSDSATQAAITTLYNQSLICPLSAVPLSTAAAWVGNMGQSVPALTGGTGALGFTSGAMSAPVYTALLAQSSDPAYGSALSQLFVATQSVAAGTPTYVKLAQLPAITLPGAESAGLAYNAAMSLLSFTGVMSAADALALLGLATDATWKTAICTLYTTSASGQTVTAPLAALPAAWGASFPDITSINGLSFSPGTLSFSGAMAVAEQKILLGLSTDTAYTDAINILYTQSNQAATASSGTSTTAAIPVTSVPLSVLPHSVTFPIAGITGFIASPPSLCFTGQMGSTVKPALEGLSADANWKPAIDNLFTNSQSTVQATAPITTTAIPAGITFPIYGVDYQSGPGLLTYTGVMSDYILELLIAAPATANTGWEAVVTSLYQNAQANLVSAVQFKLPAGLTDASFTGIAGLTSVTTAGVTVLAATGQMAPLVNQQLLTFSTDPTYTAAIGYLFQQKSAVVPAVMPVIVLPDGNIDSAAYTNGYILFEGKPNPDCMDGFNLQQLNTDPAYIGAIGWIYSLPPDGSVGAALASLPPITLPTSTIAISWNAGELGFTGQMQSGDYTTLQNLSTDPAYTTALAALNTASQITSITTLAALPSGVTVSALLPVVCQQATSGYVLSFTGLMSAAQQTTLLALSADATYTTAINNLYTQSQAQITATVPLAALPSISIPTTVNAAYDSVNGVLYFFGAVFPMEATIKATLSALSAAPEYQAALNLIASVSAKPVNYQVYAPPPQTPFATDNITLYNAGGTAPTINYVDGTIGFTNEMSFADYQGLLALSNNPAYMAAINYLYVTSAGSSTTIQSGTYLSLPQLSVPAIYANQLSYSTTTNMLTLRGYIASADKSALLSLSNNSAYQQAINTIYATVNNATLPAPQFFAALFENVWPQAWGALAPPAAATLYTYFLTAISPVYQPLKQAQALQAQIVSNYGLTAAIAAVLVTDLPVLLTAMTNKTFTGNTGAINPDPSQCVQALWYLRLARMAFVITGFNLSSANTDWLLKNGTLAQALSLIAYPNPLHLNLQFSDWEVLNNICIFNRRYGPVSIPNTASIGQNITLSVYDIILAAQTIKTDIAAVPLVVCNPGDLLGKLQALTGWSNTELLYLLNVGQPTLPNLILNPLAFANTGIAPVGSVPYLSNINILMRLSACFTMAGQLKVVPSRCVNWVIDPITSTIAVDIKQALKSIYPDSSSWMSAIQPLMNTLRQQRRDALVAYLLANVVKNPYGNFSIFPDEYHIYGNFLIDVEMAACQPSTRLIQAYCSIQLFVQRCLMNIEAPAVVIDITKDGDWDQWSWMGTFETWYAARYTLLYPENFILPQALPNQSSFFADMQDDLTQGAVTTDIVATAYGNYLQSLDEVARLEVKGMWYDHPTGVLHVFARTYGGDPSVYFYRTLNALQQWSPWVQVKADISGDQIIPVVQNGRVYLYWPIYTQTSDDDKSSKQVPPSSGSGATTPPPLKYWTIQMAFSEYVNGQWSGKKISKDSLYTQTILSGSGSPVIYPDTPEFVFMALDIPGEDASNPTAGTLQALQNNNNMYIACYQSIPNSITVSFIVSYAWKNSPNFVLNPALTTNINPQNPTFQITDLLSALNSEVVDGNNNSYNYTLSSGISDTYNLLQGDPCGFLQSIINPQMSDGSSVTISISYAIQASPDSLTLVNQVQSPIYSFNAFQLDPTRGYCTAVDLPLLDSDASTINHEWFSNSNLYNMLASGSGELYSAEGDYILGNTQGAVNSSSSFNILLPFQMGLWAIYEAVSSGNINMGQLGVLMPFFYQDASCTFFVGQAMQYNNNYYYYAGVVDNYESNPTDAGETSSFFSQAPGLTMDAGPYYQFNNFYHPFAHQFIKIFAKPLLGINAILPRSVQLTGDTTYGLYPDVLRNPIINVAANPGYQQFNFSATYSPSNSYVDKDPAGIGDPLEQMDFGPLSIAQFSGYGQYNWELFFHSTLMSAMMLSQNQQFLDADNWFKFIFNPTDTSNYPAPQKFWVTKPFFENTSANLTLDELVMLSELDPGPTNLFWLSVNFWRNDPYDPHMLAQLRITPYMYTAFMKWMDNRIAWANFNYQQYTMESVNIAIQLYMSVLECLGTQPVAIPPVVETPICNYYQVELELEVLSIGDGPEGYLSDPIVQFENLLPPAPSGSGKTGSPQKIQMLPGLYFCIPPNPVLLSYWTTVNTQLTKIQNCMNIAGQFQPLSPFPNVPGVGNMDGSGVSDFGGVLPIYRFTVMIQKATEFCNEVKSLGNSLLAALEKEDAEGLALLRASQETAVQQAIDLVKQMQITDAQLNLQNLQNNLQTVNDKIAYYTGLVQNGGLIQLEQQALSLNQFSLAMQGPIDDATLIAGVLKLIPNFNMGMEGFGGSPEVTFSLGGQQLGGAADCFVQMMSFASHFADKSATIATTNAGYSRRLAEWNYQLTLANDELAQVNTQILAAQNKIALATQDEQNQQLIIQNTEDVSSFLTNKYTSQQLYSWMVTQISNVYFQSYQLAYSFAKQAEVCFGYELGITGASYINYGYWDSLHKGLLSGEALMSSLKKMEADYYNLNIREYELTRQISLAQLDPVALLQLKSAGSCFINIPEELFDLDYPGHYFRRIKHIAVTIPGVVGPYTPVCLKMTLINNAVRVDNTAGTVNNYPRNTDSTGSPTNDSRFLDNVAAMQYIATSNGVNDSGLFEMNLHDDRYLPFERAGAISSWQLEFTSPYSQFDLSSVTDFIILFGYTSRDGGPMLQNVAAQSVQAKLKNSLTSGGLTLMRGFSARRDFPTQWYKFLNPATATDMQQLVMDITQRFPYFTNGLTIKISKVVVVADVPASSSNASSGPSANPLANLYISGKKLSNSLINFGPDPEFGVMQYSVTNCKDAPAVWTITNGAPGQATPPPVIPAGSINDLAIIFYYSVTSSN